MVPCTGSICGESGPVTSWHRRYIGRRHSLCLPVPSRVTRSALASLIGPLVAVVDGMGSIGLAQTLVWNLREPPPPLPEPSPVPAALAPQSPTGSSLAWELVPPEPPSPHPPEPDQLPAPAVLAAQPESPLRWELVPSDDGVLAFSSTISPPDPGAGIFGEQLARELVARESSLRWTLVPDDQAINWNVALADPGLRPDPPYLPEPPRPFWPKIRGLARGITVNGNPYPDTGLNVPNGFAADPEFTVSTTLTGTSRTRFCQVPTGGNWIDCADSEAYLDITPFKWDNASLGFQYTIQSLSGRNRGTGQFAGQSLGFRMAYNLTPTTGVAFGGEHVIQLDNTTDLGRNFYLVVSQAMPLSRGPDPILFVATAGIGSDFYGYGGNGTLGSTDCLSGNNISSLNFPQGRDCFWGPIGALTLHLGSRLSLGYEWFGFGIGAGLSVRPLKDLPLTFSLYATDFLGNTPSYLEGLCTTNPCQARYYGRVTMSF